MSRKKKDNVIGFDPLAWMKDDPVARVASRESRAEEQPTVSDHREQPGASVTETGAEIAEQVAGPRDIRLATRDSVVPLGDTLTIEQVGELHAELARHLAGGEVVLGAGALARLDAAGLQLLAAFMRAAGERGVRVAWQEPPPALHDAARRLGLLAALRLGT